MSDAVWILGASMTKFMRYRDKDSIDLASEAALAALDDGDVSIFDMGILAVGSLFEANAMLGQRLQKQIGQTGIPVYNVANACATGATAVRTVLMAIKAGEADMGLAVGVEKMGKAGLLGGAGRSGRERDVYERSGRYGSVMSVEGVLGTGTMPGVFAQAGMDYARQHDGVGAKQFAAVAVSGRIGEIFDAIVTGVTPKGTFVRVLKPHVEGILARGHEGADVGDKIRAKLVSVDVQRGYIDFVKA